MTTQFTRTNNFNIRQTWHEPVRDDASGIRTLYLGCCGCGTPIRADINVADIDGDAATFSVYCMCGYAAADASIVGLAEPAPPPPVPEPAPEPPSFPPGQIV